MLPYACETLALELLALLVPPSPKFHVKLAMPLGEVEPPPSNVQFDRGQPLTVNVAVGVELGGGGGGAVVVSAGGCVAPSTMPDCSNKLGVPAPALPTRFSAALPRIAEVTCDGEAEGLAER